MTVWTGRAVRAEVLLSALSCFAFEPRHFDRFDWKKKQKNGKKKRKNERKI